MLVLVVIFTEPSRCKYKTLFYSQLKIPSKIHARTHAHTHTHTYIYIYRNVQFFHPFLLTIYYIKNCF